MVDEFRIGNGIQTTVNEVSPVYFTYTQLGLVMTEAFFNEETQKYEVFYKSTEVPPICFTPDSYKKQETSNYYFLNLEVKLPRG